MSKGDEKGETMIMNIRKSLLRKENKVEETKNISNETEAIKLRIKKIKLDVRS